MDLPSLGDLFEGRYELIALLGEGGFARVFRGRDLAVGRDVAIKVLSPTGGEYSTLAGARFLRECRLIANLQDPHTITMYDFGESPSGLLYMVTEFVAGEDLRTTLQKQRRLSPRVVVRILRQLLEALREAHTNGVFHRDVKPANILVYTHDDDPYCVKLLDFGLARPVDADATQLTGAGRLVGTPRYMSPEQVFAQNLGPQSDIYSLGLVAYEMLTGEPAVDGPTMKALLRAHLSGSPVIVPESLAPPGIRAVIEKMCVRDLDERYASADEVLRALARARAELRDRTGGVAVAQPTPSAEEPEPFAEARRWTLGVCIVALGLVALIVIAAIWPTAPHDKAAQPPMPSPDERANGLLRTPSPDDEAQASSAETIPEASADVGADAPARARTPGCGRALAFGSFSLKDKVNGGLVNVRIPPGYSPKLPAPVIMVLHDTTQPSEDMVQITRLNALSDEANYVLVAPGDPDISSTWVGNGVVEHVTEALRVAADYVCLDLDRVFLIGHGNGAFAATDVACQADGVVAMALTAHRQFYEPECGRDPVPTLFIASTEDPVVPVDGGRDCLGTLRLGRGADRWSLAAQQESLSRRHRCDTARRATNELTRGGCSNPRCDISLHTCIVSGGRDWATMPARSATSFPLSPCFSEPMTFDVEGEVMRFFTEEMQRAQTN